MKDGNNQRRGNDGVLQDTATESLNLPSYIQVAGVEAMSIFFMEADVASGEAER